MTEPFDAYIKRMSKNSEYADHIVIQKLAQILNIRLNVIERNSENVFGNEKSSISLSVGYMRTEKHYVSLLSDCSKR